MVYFHLIYLGEFPTIYSRGKSFKIYNKLATIEVSVVEMNVADNQAVSISNAPEKQNTPYVKIQR